MYNKIMWTFLFIVFVIWVIFSLFEFQNKFKKLEVKEEERESFSLLINPFQAITTNKWFGEIHGIKSSIEGKAIPDWSKVKNSINNFMNNYEMISFLRKLYI